MILEGKYLYERRFEILFSDAIRYANKASDAFDKEDYNELESFARSSVLISTLLLECAANCCIDTLDLSKHFVNDIDKIPYLSKYEFYIMSIDKEKKIDRGCLEFQNAAELKSIRDLLVHPKVKRTKWKKIDENRLQADFGKTQLLKIPYNIEEWNLTDVQTSLRVVCAFLDYFFRIVCGFTPKKVENILLSWEEYNLEKHILSSSVPDSWKGAQLKWLLRLQFLGVDSPKALNI